MAGELGTNLRGKTIAVYGASSDIGRKFTQEVAARGAVVIAFARDTSKVPSIRSSAVGSIEVVQGDITKRKDVRKALRSRNVDATVNFAASFSKDFSKAKAVNVVGEQYIVDASVEFGVKRHIYISTIATLRPKSNVYGDTKRKAEDVVKAAGKRLDWIILRYASVLGTRTWNQPFKIILPYLRIAVPKVPTDAKDAVFHYVTIETVTEATLAALVARPNQTITVIDGETTVGEYLSAMEKVYDIRLSFLPSKLLQLLDKLFGKYFPFITGLSAGVEFLAHPPTFENKTMRQELQVKTRHFKKWMKTHVPKKYE
ncbi:MAG: hypothetical protein A3F31_04925 [Candidatus Levybacteria bacterium RIFCSPHIGHO2_12_FULL_38_12]|nr:MAG: hypothetical protein A2770_04610 [Candidatus Levybacteria bacterium RIFCSPHIGHO2_01_FULL_38_12]OGH21747.1 MAG: hypothetical protein A3D75_00980 [Candidatus Levybacteria bacterium RIFCSPHIGHO2_02_FULL_37_18]OGH22595.1 MAG: hypothetical protein A3F31_04925 [Candidatus Levybacteria bacterium RIFCSPHIGHO2_12_FULL_38_12]OGH33368.1 MAG: hypothetical protein A3A47_03930 [Candidatus Levybacteria bacterium RIFCSPLOWO2_01_FULL_37_20]OGH44133.1 MAG: hypothetical protein A3J14_05295 [Candidatus Lev